MTELTLLNITINVLVFAALIFINAIFVAGEFAYIRIRKTQVKTMQNDPENFSKTSQKMMYLINDLDITVAACQFGISVATVTLGAVSEDFFRSLLLAGFSAIGLDMANQYVFIFSFSLALFFLVAVQIILGEQVPKIIGIRRVISTAQALAWYLYYFVVLTKPIIKVMNRLTFLFLKPLNIQEGADNTVVYTENEIKAIIEDSIDKGEIKKSESELINKIFDFTDLEIKNILTPRFKVKAVKIGATSREIIEFSNETGHSRFPVYEEKLDNMKGNIHIKDVLTSLSQKFPNRLDDPFSFGKLRQNLIVYEASHVDSILKEMQRKRVQIAIVVDEWGSVEGLVTIEDILEAIVGPIEDEFDGELDNSQEALRKKIENGSTKFTLNGQITLEEFNDAFESKGISLHAKDGVTLAGYLLELLDSKIPEKGKKVNDEHLQFKVVEMKENRINAIEVSIREKSPVLQKQQKKSNSKK